MHKQLRVSFLLCVFKKLMMLINPVSFYSANKFSKYCGKWLNDFNLLYFLSTLNLMI